MIGVINYRAGNAPSVMNALQHLGVPASFVSQPEDPARCGALILPGVGSAAATMDSLRELNIIEALEARVLKDKVPFLGICIGMQILFDFSAEDNAACLGWLRGEVLHFDPARVRIPQIGWNEVVFRDAGAVTAGLGTVGHFYFVNSYYVVPRDRGIVFGVTDYGGEFCSMVISGNICATQFHVEKSGPGGLKLLGNFANLAGGGI